MNHYRAYMALTDPQMIYEVGYFLPFILGSFRNQD